MSQTTHTAHTTKETQPAQWETAGISFLGLGCRYPARTLDYYTQHLAFSKKQYCDVYNLSYKDSTQQLQGISALLHHVNPTLNVQNSNVLYQFLFHKAKCPSVALLHFLHTKFPLLDREKGVDSIGIIALKFECEDVHILRNAMSMYGYEVSHIALSPDNKAGFFFRDTEYNWIYCFEDTTKHTCSLSRLRLSKKPRIVRFAGLMIGTQDIDATIAFYRSIAKYDTVVFDEQRKFEDFSFLPRNQEVRRTKIICSKKGTAVFPDIFFGFEIELVSVNRNNTHSKEGASTTQQSKEQRKEINAESDDSVSSVNSSLSLLEHYCTLGIEVSGIDAFVSFCAEQEHIILVEKEQSMSTPYVSSKLCILKDPNNIPIMCNEIEK